MTWTFLYAAALVVGLALGAVTGLLRNLRLLAHHLVVPHPDLHSAVPTLLGKRLAVGLVAAGLVGLVLSARPLADPKHTLVIAAGSAAVALVLAVALLRPRCAELLTADRATVVRDIPPGGYGQVRFEREGGSVVLAAQSVDATTIPAGTEVEVVDCTRSVVTVRKHGSA